MEIRALLVVSFALFGRGAVAQQDTIWVGTPNGISTNQFNTPFWNVGARAGRTQYLVRSEDLIAAGLTPGEAISGVCVDIVDDDAATPPCIMDLHCALKNTASPAALALEESGLFRQSNTNDITLVSGVLGLGSDTNQFQWNGSGFNLLVEITFERGMDEGIGPRIELVTGLNYVATLSGTTTGIMMGSDINSLTPNTTIGSDNSLPRLGLLKSGSAAVERNAYPKPELSLFPVPVGDRLTVTGLIDAPFLLIEDASGRTATKVATSPMAPVNIDLSRLTSGVYFLRVPGSPRLSRPFVKE